MAKFDRYMLSQLLLLFGFFSLVLVALFWINRAVVLFDRLIGDGHSALVFLEFTALGLPRLIATVLPIATFAGAVYVTNRMSTEAEMTVMQSTGSSPWRLARPVLAYGLCVALMMSILSHLLVPLAQRELNQREVEIAQNVTAGLLKEGQFLHPSANVTFYTRLIGMDGVLHDVFLSDRRGEVEDVIYTASEAYLVRNGTGTTLILVDGLAQRLQNSSQALSTAKFRDFSFDISAMMRRDNDGLFAVSDLTTPVLLRGVPQTDDKFNVSAGIIAEELNSRFAQSLFCVVAALFGFSILMMGGFSRFGVWREIAVAFFLLIAIDGTRGTLVRMVQTQADLWPVLYLPSLVGALIIVAALWQSAHPGWIRRLITRRRPV